MEYTLTVRTNVYGSKWVWSLKTRRAMESLKKISAVIEADTPEEAKEKAIIIFDHLNIDIDVED
jgi:hypothetical protein